MNEELLMLDILEASPFLQLEIVNQEKFSKKYFRIAQIYENFRKELRLKVLLFNNKTKLKNFN
jgi:hypothetical protein